MVLTRRGVLGAGLSVAACAFSGGTRAQSDGFRILRARPEGYEGATPGPVLRVRRGDEIKVRLINELNEPTAVHWHGVRLANAMDGVPNLTQAPVAPGASFDYRFVAPDAGTFWYHAPFTLGQQIDRGLAGALIVEEPQPLEVDHDVVLLLSQRQAGGERGSATLAINGASTLDVPVRPNGRVRLRLINATSARVIPLRLDAPNSLVMAIDGQPAEAFPLRDGRLALGPGNRMDVFVDMTATVGKAAALTTQGNPEAVLAQFKPDQPALPSSRGRLAALPENSLPQRIELAGAQRVEMAIPGKPIGTDFGPPLFSVKRGRAVVLALTNRSANAASVHVHGHSARLLDRLDDGWKPFWLDTVLVPAREIWRITFLADNPGKWLIEGRTVDQPEPQFAAWFAVS
jgi:FtsP/CotA-like multicopper oxidase with cupredoxin domain